MRFARFCVVVGEVVCETSEAGMWLDWGYRRPLTILTTRVAEVIASLCMPVKSPHGRHKGLILEDLSLEVMCRAVGVG
jgi:hypothetical protein